LGWISKEIFFSTGAPGSYSNVTLEKLISPAPLPEKPDSNGNYLLAKSMATGLWDYPMVLYLVRVRLRLD
jgi:hypothetical protein